MAFFAHPLVGLQGIKLSGLFPAMQSTFPYSAWPGNEARDKMCKHRCIDRYKMYDVSLKLA